MTNEAYYCTEGPPGYNGFEKVADDGPVNTHMTMRPRSGDTPVHEHKTTIHNIPWIETFYAISQTYLTGISWEEVCHCRNQTASPQKYTASFTTQLVVTKGHACKEPFNLASQFEGLQIMVGNKIKKFKSTETTSSKTDHVDLVVNPQTQAYVYQKKYRFKTKVWFKQDSWNTMWTLVRDGRTVMLELEVEISVGECLLRKQEMSGEPFEVDVCAVKFVEDRQRIERETGACGLFVWGALSGKFGV